IGGFNYERDHGYQILWDSLDSAHRWLKREMAEKTIELRRKDFTRNRNESPVWLEKSIYICAWNGTGGIKKEEKMQRNYKVGTKRIKGGCQCCLTMKTYPETSKVLGLYKVEHTHELGNANICYTCVPEDDWVEI
ncbi:hypothetical protein BT96DRAFT_789101, partial [Gymnopus androsaceus JB14]